MRVMLCLILFLLPGAAAANDWDALSQPGAIAVMRHALAPGTGDPASLTIGDCSTQRNLDGRGRDQARAIGQAFRDRGIAFDTVFTSQWCRTRETAELLGLGPVTEAPPLNSFFGDFSTRDRQTAETRALIAANPGRLMLVTHQVNISALAGRSTRSGEVLVIRLTPDGAEVLGSILIAP
jgi:phosphohistidine phosphatase SixA